MIGLNAGLIGARRITTTGIAPGIWSPNEQVLAQRDQIWPIPGSDPFFSSVVLLLHMDGANLSTVVTDSSSYARTVTRGAGSISTVQSKFGGASYSFPGAAGGLSVASDDLLGPTQYGGFTVEFWLRPSASAISTSNQKLAERLSTTGWSLRLGSVTLGCVSASFTNATSGTITITDPTPLLAETWVNIALVRDDTNIRLFRNGVQVALATNFNGPVLSATASLGICNNSPYYVGYVDELRVSQMARYTSNFTPSPAAFPSF